MQNTEDVAACGHSEAIYVLLHLHNFVMILSTRRRNSFLQIPEFYTSFRTLTSVIMLTVILPHLASIC